LYDFFIKMQAIKAVIKAKTYDNPFTWWLCRYLKETYTTAQVDAYLNGEFVNLNSASVYTTHIIVKHTEPM
jgi:hypothetical protein